MTRDEFLDRVYYCLEGNIDEPAGRDAGYGITEDGNDMLDELANELFKTETNLEKESNMKDPKVFKVTAIEYFKAVKDEDPKDPNILIWQENRIGTDAEAVKFAVQHELANHDDVDDVAAFFNRLEVKVEAVNFCD